jgi:diguanylate cyclase (GGDEF)-like protein
VKILILDKNPVTPNFYKIKLSRFIKKSYELIETKSSDEMWSILKKNYKNIDCLLIDIGTLAAQEPDTMPQFLKQTIDDLPPILALTQSLTDFDFMHTLSYPIADYLEKEKLEGPLLEKAILYLIEKHKMSKLISKQRENLEHLTNYDTLTQLPNRMLFEFNLKQSLLRAERNHRATAVLFIDIDNFNAINTSLKHSDGDKLLQLVGERMRTTVRKHECLARIGADEFGVILEDIQDETLASLFAQRLQNTLMLPFKVNDTEIFLTVSIGIASYPNNGNAPDELIKKADMALFCAKESGGNNYQFFINAMNTQALVFLETKNALGRALENKEFILCYQPIYDLVTSKITYFEALLRWKLPDGSIIEPTEFITIAEDSGLIVPIGYWVIEQVCLQIKEWQGLGKNYRIAINVSMRQFVDKDFLLILQNNLRKNQLTPAALEIELTESMLVENYSATIILLNELKSLGFRLTLDDFGMGYSSLKYLKDMPIDALKIDRFFIQDIVNNSQDRAIVKAIITLGAALNKTIIAEGIETLQQLSILHKLHCHCGQGYFLCRPQLPDYEF